MKTIKYQIIKMLGMVIPLSVVLGLALTSCDIDSSTNNSPNAINETAVKSRDGVYGLSVALQAAIGDFYSGDRSRVGSMWTWQMCAPDGLGRAQPVSWNFYNQQEDGPPNDMWLIAYRGVRLANDIIRYAPEVFTETGDAGLKNTLLGMAKAYKAIFLGECAAYYGDIPINITGLAAPKFATQKEAYAEVQKLLSEALEHFKAPAGYTRDLNFGGDGTKWTKVIHSLKARYFLHVKQYQSALDEAGQGITDASNDLYGLYYNIAGQYSPWGHWTLTETNEPIRAEAHFIRLLKSEPGDKRLAEYFTPNSDGEFWGFAVHTKDNLDSNETKLDALPSLNKYGKYDSPFPLMRYAETVLIIAECKARLSSAGTDELNIIRNAAGLPNYSGTDVLAEILKQKYLELFLEGQSYTDMRRTGTLPEPTVPKRFIYPVAEKNANPYVPYPESDVLVKEILP